MLGPNRVIARDVKSCTYYCYVRFATLIVWVRGMPWPQTGETLFHAQIGLQDKGCALGCYQPTPKVLIVSYYNLEFYFEISLISRLFEPSRSKLWNLMTVPSRPLNNTDLFTLSSTCTNIWLEYKVKIQVDKLV